MTSPFGLDAIVVNTVRRGPRQMMGMGDGLVDLANSLTGGKVTDVQNQLDRLELALKVSIAASCVAGLAGLAVLLSRKR